MPESTPLDFTRLAAQFTGQNRLDSATARALAERLLAEPPRRRLTLVRNSRRMGTPEVCRALLDLAMEKRFDDVPGMLRAARAALCVATEIHDTLPAAVANDIRAEAWAVLGNAHRIAGDFRSARGSFAEAYKYHAAGIGDPLMTALIFSFEGSLERRQQRVGDALARFRTAYVLHLEVGDNPGAARQLIKIALMHIDGNEHRLALNVLDRAAALVASSPDPFLKLTVMHNSALCLVATGCAEAARSMLRRVRRAGGGLRPTLALRSQGLEARLAHQHGDWDTAIALFEDVHEEFARRGFELDAAEAGLELATLLEEAHEHRRLRELAEQLYPIFLSKNMPGEALGAALLFVESVRLETGQTGLAERALLALREARKHTFQRI